MKTVLVTGATGLIGSCVCAQLIERGDRARAVARRPDSADALALQGIGVEVIAGDITDVRSLQAAVDGVDGVIHSAALRGVPSATLETSVTANVIGAMNVLTAAHGTGAPVVQLLTNTFFDMSARPLTETSPLDLALRNTDAYSLTKRLAYVEALARVASGQDVRFVVPGGVYGPTVCLENGMYRPSFNDRIASAITGTLQPQMPYVVPGVLADDCAEVSIAALERGRAGERYLAMGRQQDAATVAGFCNVACEVAGVDHRVEEVPKERLDDPEIVARYGATGTTLGKRTYPDPLFDSTVTEERLGYRPTPLEDGLRATIDWMRRQGFVAAPSVAPPPGPR
jgi:dihydroflavonol-4-reductase